jgi:hypothetical protein
MIKETFYSGHNEAASQSESKIGYSMWWGKRWQMCKEAPQRYHQFV